MSVDRIIFTVDILRPFLVNDQWESATKKNIRWLEHLLGWQLSKATGLPKTSVSWKINGFDTPSIYAALGLPLNYESWASLFYRQALPENVEAMLVAPYQRSLVIGCEIPDVLQGVLTRHGIPYLDIVSHPVRFMEDLLFGFRTNHPAIHAKLLNHHIALDDYCVPRANLLQAKVAWMPPMQLPPGTALIAGQVSTDKAVICRQTGKFLNLGDYASELRQIKNNHPLVLFKPHPYQDSQCPSRQAIATLGGVCEVSQNFYYLLSQDGLTDVYAINSGTVTEAPYFGRKGTSLGKPLYSFGETPPAGQASSDAIALDLSFLEPAFWADILEPLLPVKSELPKGPSARPSLLRRSLNADWDYGFIDEIVQRSVV